MGLDNFKFPRELFFQLLKVLEKYRRLCVLWQLELTLRDAIP